MKTKGILKQIIIFFFIILLLSDCKKSNTNTDHNCIITAVVLDLETNTPITNEKVYLGPITLAPGSGIVYDSAITNTNGKVIFNINPISHPGIRVLNVEKPLYISQYPFVEANSCFYNNIDTLYIYKPSNLALTIHKANSYLPMDSVSIQIKGNFFPYYTDYYSFWHIAKANSADTLFSLSTYYKMPEHTKVYFKWNILRNGTVLSSAADSVNLLQHGTVNYNLNY